MYTIIYSLARIYAAAITPIIPIELEDYINIFSAKEAGKLLLNKVGDHAINIDRDPLYSPLYNLSIKELIVL